MATREEITAARDAAIGVMRDAKRIIRTYADPVSWRLSRPNYGGGSAYRAKDVGGFIRRVNDAWLAIEDVDGVLPRTPQPVRYGEIVGGTAHMVAVKFAQTVVGELSAAFNNAQGDDDSDAAGALYNRAMSGDVDGDFLDQCSEHIRAALSRIAIIDTEGLFFAVDNESRLSVATQGVPPANELDRLRQLFTANQGRTLVPFLFERIGKAVRWNVLPEGAFQDHANIDDESIEKALKRISATLNKDGQYELSISKSERTTTLRRLNQVGQK